MKGRGEEKDPYFDRRKGREVDEGKNRFRGRLAYREEAQYEA